MGIFQITVQGEAPQLFVGSEDAVRDRCAAINKGTRGKCLYDPEQAHAILTAKPIARRGRPRNNQ